MPCTGILLGKSWHSSAIFLKQIIDVWPPYHKNLLFWQCLFSELTKKHSFPKLMIKVLKQFVKNFYGPKS